MSMKAMRNALNTMYGYDAFRELDASEYAELLSEDFTSDIIVEMQRQNLQFKDLAERMGLKPAALSRRLRSHNLTLKSLVEFARALGYDIDTPALTRIEDAKPSMPSGEAGRASRPDAYSYPEVPARCDSVLDERDLPDGITIVINNFNYEPAMSGACDRCPKVDYARGERPTEGGADESDSAAPASAKSIFKLYEVWKIA